MAQGPTDHLTPGVEVSPPAVNHLAEQRLGRCGLQIQSHLLRQIVKAAELPQFLQHGAQEQRIGRAWGADNLVTQFLAQFLTVLAQEGVNHLAALGRIGQRQPVLRPAALGEGVES